MFLHEAVDRRGSKKQCGILIYFFTQRLVGTHMMCLSCFQAGFRVRYRRCCNGIIFFSVYCIRERKDESE